MGVVVPDLQPSAVDVPTRRKRLEQAFHTIVQRRKRRLLDEGDAERTGRVGPSAAARAEVGIEQHAGRQRDKHDAKRKTLE